MEKALLYGQSFGQWLRQQRRTLDVTQQELADRLGCAKSTIRMIENGERRPSKQMALLLATHLGIPEEEHVRFLQWAREQQGSDGVGEEGPAREMQAADALQLPGNVPAPLTALLGRDEDLTNVTGLLLRDDVRLVTLTGAPGIGKTSLATEVGLRLQAGQVESQGASRFRDGIFWVPLAAVDNPGQVVPAIARQFEVQETSGRLLMDSLKAALKHRKLMLVLDNFEQVVEASLRISELLAGCPSLKVLVTSREPLKLRGEWNYSLEPLALPDLANLPATDELARNPAVALFLQRAQSADRHFLLTSENGAAVSGICVQLDGLPLAIELVAAHVRLLPLAALLERLQGVQREARASLLGEGPRDLPERHSTVRKAISWSNSLLSTEEQALFRRLGIFRGGFTLGAAEAICNTGSGPRVDLLEIVSQLLRKSLIQRVSLPTTPILVAGEPRYRMLETVRDYAVEQLEESGEAEDMGRAHAEFFLAMVASVPGGNVTEEKRQLFDRMDRDYDNVRAALFWTLEHERPDMAARFGMMLTAYWVLRGYYREGLDWLSRILEVHTKAGDDPATLGARSYLLYYASMFNTYLTDYIAASAHIDRAVSIQGEMGADPQASAPYLFKATIAHQQQDYAEVESIVGNYLPRAVANGNKMGEINCLWVLGSIASEQGDQQKAIDLFARSLTGAREIGDVYVAMGTLRDLAMAFAYAGEYARAEELYEEYFRLVEHSSIQVGVSWGLIGQAYTATRQGDPARARQLYLRSLTLSKTMEKQRTPECLEGLAEVELASSSHVSPASARKAATLLGAATAIRRVFGVSIIPARASMREHLVADARTTLGDAEYSRAYAVGEAMSLEEALSWVLNDSSKVTAEQ